tara:strand:+ start:961 stop:1305 length:345 start_codon:yes stop_codon:yes gene_type:complete
MKDLFLALAYFSVGHTLIWYQTNGQFIWTWFAKNPLILSIVGGTIISYTFITGTKYIVAFSGGLLWPGRLLGFGLGITAFTILTLFYMGEGLTTKTVTSLFLALALVCIQIFWK